LLAKASLFKGKINCIVAAAAQLLLNNIAQFFFKHPKGVEEAPQKKKL